MALFKAVVWALIFLTKLSFPSGVFIAMMNYSKTVETLHLSRNFCYFECILRHVMPLKLIKTKNVNTTSTCAEATVTNL